MLAATNQVDTTVFAAFAVGFVSFISPCVLPLVPGYLSAISGVSLEEIRDVLEHTQIADEIVKVLTKLSFEIKTEIRFIPNDAAPDGKRDEEGEAPGGGPVVPVKPKVTSEVTMHNRGRDERARR